MPVVAPSSKVLVTGANSFVGAWLIQALLEKGYAVRGAVRSQSKGFFLLDKFKPYDAAFELAIVEDITKEGAFDEAVKGVDAIEHIAFPVKVDFNCKPEEIIEPGLKGTLRILQSAKNVSSIKRIVIIGSTTAVEHMDTKPLTFTENDWNDKAVEEVDKLGRGAGYRNIYSAAKVHAERAAWSFYHEHKKNLSWELVVIISPIIFGPSLDPSLSLADLHLSAQVWYAAVLVPNQTREDVLTMNDPYADIKDVITALTESLSVAEAGGERIIVVAGSYTRQDLVNAARAISPSQVSPAAPGTEVPSETPYLRNCDNSKSKKILGLQYRTLEETSKVMLEDFKRRGL